MNHLTYEGVIVLKRKKMDEIIESRIEVELELYLEKVDFINDAYEKGLRYWKKVALQSVSTKNETRKRF